MDASISTSSSPLRFTQKPPNPTPLLNPTPRLARRRAISPSPSPPTPQQQQPMEVFGFDALKETFSVDVAAAEARPLNVPLVAPFTITSSRLEAVANVVVRVELSSGAVGRGEAPALPSASVERTSPPRLWPRGARFSAPCSRTSPMRSPDTPSRW